MSMAACTHAPRKGARLSPACQDAVAVVEWISRRPAGAEEPDERTLFTALRTCAQEMSRPRRGIRPAAATAIWAHRWETVRSYLTERNMGLVYSIIQRVGCRKASEDDLLSDGLYALTRAVDRFDPTKGYRFSTYACTVIARDLMRRGKRETNYRRLFPVQHDVTFERPTRPADRGTELYVERLQIALNQNLGNLTELETQVLSRRFPENTESRLTFLEIGSVIGLSKERIRQIQNSALRKLRRVLDEDPVLQDS